MKRFNHLASLLKVIKAASRLALLLLVPLSAIGQSTAFTYQGQLNDSGKAASGQYDFQFKLYDAQTDGTEVGTFTVESVSVSNGIFTTAVNFGAGAFDGSARFLEVSVKPVGGGSYTTLSPRRRVFSSPYAIKSINSDNATTAATADKRTSVRWSKRVAICAYN